MLWTLYWTRHYLMFELYNYVMRTAKCQFLLSDWANGKEICAITFQTEKEEYICLPQDPKIIIISYTFYFIKCGVPALQRVVLEHLWHYNNFTVIILQDYICLPQDPIIPYPFYFIKRAIRALRKAIIEHLWNNNNFTVIISLILLCLW